MRVSLSRRRAVLGVVLALLGIAVPRAADDVTVMSSGGYTAALEQLAPGFEQATGHRVRLVLGPSMGDSPEAIPNRLARGEQADLVIMVGSALGDLIARGVVRTGSRVDLADSKIGLAVRAGQPIPDIGTVDALRRVLLAARSIAYSDSASGVYVERELYRRLGVEAELKPKSRMIVAERVGNVVARGEAEIGFQQVSELLPIAGLAFAGTIPDEVQKVTMFSAGIPASAAHPDLARQLLDYLTSPASRTIVERTGLAPLR